MQTKQSQFKLGEREIAELDRLAQKYGLTRSDVVRIAIHIMGRLDLWLDRNLPDIIL